MRKGKGFMMQSRVVGTNAIQLSLGSALRFALSNRATRNMIIAKLAKGHFDWKGKAQVTLFPWQRVIKLEAVNETGTTQE